MTNHVIYSVYQGHIAIYTTLGSHKMYPIKTHLGSTKLLKFHGSLCEWLLGKESTCDLLVIKAFHAYP